MQQKMAIIDENPTRGSNEPEFVKGNKRVRVSIEQADGSTRDKFLFLSPEKIAELKGTTAPIETQPTVIERQEIIEPITQPEEKTQTPQPVVLSEQKENTQISENKEEKVKETKPKVKKNSSSGKKQEKPAVKKETKGKQKKK